MSARPACDCELEKGHTSGEPIKISQRSLSCSPGYSQERKRLFVIFNPVARLGLSMGINP
jgi:hypothetical protein